MTAADQPEAAWFVYILLNDRGTTYTGISTDVDRRLCQHNAGSGARFTRGRGPWRLLHCEGPLGHGDALRRELGIKKDARFRAGLKRGALPQTP